MTAANTFFACAQNSPSENVLERRTCYQAAGDCYSNACDLKNTGNSYQFAELYTEAACAYQEGGYFDEMVELITQHTDAFDDGHYEQLIIAAQIHYFKVLPNNCFISEHH